jgi:hypothetical protein
MESHETPRVRPCQHTWKSRALLCGVASLKWLSDLGQMAACRRTAVYGLMEHSLESVLGMMSGRLGCADVRPRYCIGGRKSF